MIIKVVRNVGRVLQVKADSTAGSTLRAGRAEVELNLSEPLKKGQLIRIKKGDYMVGF